MTDLPMTEFFFYSCVFGKRNYRVLVRVCVFVFEVHIFKHKLYISALEQARVLILIKYVLLGVINTVYKHCHASVIL